MEAPALTDEAIRVWVDAGTWTRSNDYFDKGKVFAPRRQGATLKARVEGSGAAPYHTRLTLAPDGTIFDAHCTCAVGADGRCKHVCALARTWAASPDSFLVVDPLEVALRRRSRAELEALITQMLKQDPELETLLETALPGIRPGTLPPQHAPVYRRQAEEVFREHGVSFAALVPIVDGLRPLVDIGVGFLDARDADRAALTFDEVAQAVLDRYELYAAHDVHGRLRAVVTDCVHGLTRCLQIDGAPREARRRALRALVDVLDADADAGLADDVPDALLEHCLPEERAVVAAWLRALGEDEVTEGEETPWDKIRHGQLLFDLVVDELPEEAFARACRLLHRWAQLVEHLLLLGRADEALAVAREAETVALPAVADALARHGRAEEAERILARRADEEPDAEVFAWLLHRGRGRANPETVRRWTEGLLVCEPELERFLALRAMTPADAWPAVRDRVLARPSVQANATAYVRMLLAEGEVDLALARVADEPTVAAHRDGSVPGTRLLVAEAIHATRPEASIAIWEKHIDDLVATGLRPRYREAVAYAQKVMHALDATGGSATPWLKALKEKHSRRHALREELARVGL